MVLIGEEGCDGGGRCKVEYDRSIEGFFWEGWTRTGGGSKKKRRVFFRLKGLQTLEDAIPYLCGEDLAQTFLCLRTSEKQTDCKPLCLRVVCASQTEEVT